MGSLLRGFPFVVLDSEVPVTWVLVSEFILSILWWRRLNDKPRQLLVDWGSKEHTFPL